MVANGLEQLFSVVLIIIACIFAIVIFCSAALQMSNYTEEDYIKEKERNGLPARRKSWSKK